MLYYNGKLVDYKNGKDEFSSKLRADLHELSERFFGSNAPGYAILRYPKGERRKNVTGLYEPVKPYVVDHRSYDGQWFYSKKAPRIVNGREEFTDRFTVVRDPYTIYERDLEFLWFLLNHSSSLKAGRIYVEDKEALAEKEAKSLASDVDIRFMIYGKQSPIAQDKEIFRQVATIFGVKEVGRLGFMQLKNVVYGLVSNGERDGNRFINFDVFEKLVNGNVRRRVSHTVRSAINDGSLKFNPKDYKWYFSVGGEYVEELHTLKLIDVPHKEELLIEAALSDGALKGAIFSALGKDDFENADELREYDRKVLMGMGNRYGVEVSSKDTKEDIVKKLCEKLNVAYTPKSA